MFVVENWGWPQWVVIVISLLDLSLGIGFHGKRSTHSVGAALVAIPITVAILAFGGFFH